MVDLSVYLCIPRNFVEREFTVYEALTNALIYADEVSVVVEPTHVYEDYDNWELDYELIAKAEEGYEDKLRHTFNEWEQCMYPMMYALQKNLALSHCTSKWCLLHDADEVMSPELYESIRKNIELLGDQADAFSIGTHHLYGSYNHVRFAEPGGSHQWYDHKPRLFKTGLGIHHNKDGFDIDALMYAGGQGQPKNVRVGNRCLYLRGPRVHHYSHVRSIDSYVVKKNAIEYAFHKHQAPVINDYEYDMDGAEEFTGEHPDIMQGRIACGIDHDAIVEYYKGLIE